MNRIRYTIRKFAGRLACAAPLAFAAIHAGAAAPATPADLLEPEAAFRVSARFVDSATVAVTYAIADGYYMYRDKFRFRTEPESGGATAPQFPSGLVKDDPNFGRVETYRREVTIQLGLASPAGDGLVLIATSQGCADVGVCYLPMTTRVPVAPASAQSRPREFADPKPLSSLLNR